MSLAYSAVRIALSIINPLYVIHPKTYAQRKGGVRVKPRGRAGFNSHPSIFIDMNVQGSVPNGFEH